MEIMILSGIVLINVMAFLLYLFQKRENNKIRKSLENNMVSVESKIMLIEEEKQKAIEIEKNNIMASNIRKKNIKQTIKSGKTIEDILRELQNEGISSIIDEENISAYSIGGNLTNSSTKYVYFSYDDKKDMYKLLLENKKTFNKQYKVKIKYKELETKIRKYYHDKEVVKEAIKDKIKLDLANEIADILTNDNKQESESEKELEKFKQALFQAAKI